MNATNQKKIAQLRQPGLDETIKMKDNHVKPLSYNISLQRLTQLFGRPLQMKYYNTKQNAV